MVGMVIHREYSPQTSDKPKSSVSPAPGSAADDRTPGDVLIGWNEGGRRGVGRRHPRDRDVSGVVDGEHALNGEFTHGAAALRRYNRRRVV